MTSEAPKPTGKPAAPVSLTGTLIPWSSEDQPVLLNMPGSRHFYLPCFTTEDRLREMMGRAGISFQKIKQVDDGPEFLTSVSPSARVIVDPHLLENGRVRFLEIQSFGSHEDPSIILGMNGATS